MNHNAISPLNNFLPLNNEFSNFFSDIDEYNHFAKGYNFLKNTNDIKYVKQINAAACCLFEAKYYMHAKKCFEKSLFLMPNQFSILMKYADTLYQLTVSIQILALESILEKNQFLVEKIMIEETEIQVKNANEKINKIEHFEKIEFLLKKRECFIAECQSDVCNAINKALDIDMKSDFVTYLNI